MAQLVEHWLPKPRVAGSSPVCRSINNQGVTCICNTFFYVRLGTKKSKPDITIGLTQSKLLTLKNTNVPCLFFPCCSQYPIEGLVFNLFLLSENKGKK